ncbi:MAG: acetate--CoA ligase family protein [Pseudomonadota bacterium]
MAIDRLLQARDIAVIGGGTWCEAIIGAARQLGFAGRITPVHPTKTELAGVACVARVADLPTPPDAAFVGVNRAATVEVVAELAAIGAGGATCFASGFAEAEAESEGAGSLQDALVAAAGDMTILGPNCYGFLNAVDGVGLWPDQHGLVPVERGVAILTQSSNIAINLTMQTRGLPISYVVTCGNQAQTRQTDIALSLLDDPRVTAIGLHIEGFGDLRAWETLAQAAAARGVALVALKAGRSQQARAATVSHTASLAGEDAGAQALLDRLGIARVNTLAVFLEALKIGHLFGRLPSGNIASISCSGGEAALAADAAVGHAVTFPPLTQAQTDGLRAALGPRVALANPLDYHTYIWRDGDKMAEAWGAMSAPHIALTLIILDYPRGDRCDPVDWDIATAAVIAAARATGRRYAVCATLPELLPEETATALLDAGVLPLCGLDHAIAAIDVMAQPTPITPPAPILLPGRPAGATTLSEADAKRALAEFGIVTPRGGRQIARDALASDIAGRTAPMAVKVLGLAHKTGQGGLALNIRTPEQAEEALTTLADGPLWVEEMVPGGLVELLLGVTRDPAHGYMLTIGAGGTLTELLSDTATLLIPATRQDVATSLETLRIYPLLTGYRGSAPVAIEALLDAVDALQRYVVAHADDLEEVEINPLILTADRAIAVDALIRKAVP